MFLVFCRCSNSASSKIRAFARPQVDSARAAIGSRGSLRSRGVPTRGCWLAPRRKSVGNGIPHRCSNRGIQSRYVRLDSAPLLLAGRATRAVRGNYIHGYIRNPGNLGGAEAEVLLGHLDGKVPQPLVQ